MAKKIADWTGSPYACTLAILLIFVWLFSGPYFQYSDTWQLIINTLTTVITFLMVFLIQNTQNRDTKALHLKLDELIRVHKFAHNSFIDLDELSDEDIRKLEEKYKKLSHKDEEPRDATQKS
ncbi:MAG TPA: low affinity iron permease family protein [Gammaproteobacteria bacterium]|nr:low affinity iron permease family protein [Gammaproteobacteria bacterium]